MRQLVPMLGNEIKLSYIDHPSTTVQLLDRSVCQISQTEAGPQTPLYKTLYEELKTGVGYFRYKIISSKFP